MCGVLVDCLSGVCSDTTQTIARSMACIVAIAIVGSSGGRFMFFSVLSDAGSKEIVADCAPHCCSAMFPADGRLTARTHRRGNGVERWQSGLMQRS
jgi:hypothetical protein